MTVDAGDGLLAQYDGEMATKTAELRGYEEAHLGAQGRLEEVERLLQALDEKQAQREAEERREHQRRMHFSAITTRMEASSKLLQAHIRGHAVRQRLRKRSPRLHSPKRMK